MWIWLFPDAPVLTESIVTPLAVRGSDVTLKCKGHGNPPVTFQWFKVVVRLVSLFSVLAKPINPLDSKGNYSATSNNTKLVHWPLMGGAAPPSFLLAVPYVTARSSTASVPITVLLYDIPLLCGFNFNVAIEELKPTACNEIASFIRVHCKFVILIWINCWYFAQCSTTISYYVRSANELFLHCSGVPRVSNPANRGTTIGLLKDQ